MDYQKTFRFFVKLPNCLDLGGLYVNTFKGLSHQILWDLFLACMGRYGQEKEPLLFFKFSVAPSIFGGHFKVWKHLIPGISEMNVQMWTAVLGDFLFPSQRTAG